MAPVPRNICYCRGVQRPHTRYAPGCAVLATHAPIKDPNCVCDYAHVRTHKPGAIKECFNWIAFKGKDTEEPVSEYVELPDASAWSKQHGGSHYSHFKIQPLDFAMQNNLNAMQFSILKYVMRYPLKGQALDDLLKARDVLDKLIETVTKEQT